MLKYTNAQICKCSNAPNAQIAFVWWLLQAAVVRLSHEGKRLTKPESGKMLKKARKHYKKTKSVISKYRKQQLANHSQQQAQQSPTHAANANANIT